jgi:uncharacterized protein YfdQ (DUF2303 family)
MRDSTCIGSSPVGSFAPIVTFSFAFRGESVNLLSELRIQGYNGQESCRLPKASEISIHQLVRNSGFEIRVDGSIYSAKQTLNAKTQNAPGASNQL